MNTQLARTAMINSGILCFMFLMQTASAFAAGSQVLGLIGALATVFTALDAQRFYNALKETK